MKQIISVFMFILTVFVVLVWAIVLVPLLVLSVFQIVLIEVPLKRPTRLLADRWLSVIEWYNRWAMKVVA